MAAASLRERLHEMVDELPESGLPAVDVFMRFVRHTGGLVSVETRGTPHRRRSANGLSET